MEASFKAEQTSSGEGARQADAMSMMSCINATLPYTLKSSSNVSVYYSARSSNNFLK